MTGQPPNAPAPSVDMAKLDQVLAGFGKTSPSDVIPLLQQVQDSYGYLPREALEHLARRTKIPLTQFYGVATFYSQFSLVPKGKHTVRVCRGTACHVRGGKKVQQAVQQQLGLTEGETSKDMQFTFETVGCLGACALSPLMTVGHSYYGKMTPGRAKTMLAEIVRQ